MSQKASGAKCILLESPVDFFRERVDEASERLKFKPLPRSKQYLVELLQHYMFASNLFQQDEETGRQKQESLAEIYLRALNSPPPLRLDLLKKLGDSSLYISGFFGDSLARKLVDIDYYVDMGEGAYGALSSSASDELLAEMFSEFSRRFTTFVDILTVISQEAMVQTNEDLLRLYDRYITTGSRLAEEQLLEKGLLNADLQKVKINKM